MLVLWVRSLWAIGLAFFGGGLVYAGVLSPGEPIIENFSAREIGVDATCWTAVQDQAGHLLVGSEGLTIFDGSDWRTISVPGSYCVRAIAPDSGGRIWVGAINEIGYFSSGYEKDLQYHSLVSKLPPGTPLLGDVWNVFIDGPNVVFVTHDRILTWNGNRFTQFDLPGNRRLFASRLGDTIFIHDLRTGLYSYRRGQLHLVISSKILNGATVMWVDRLSDGNLLLGTSEGFSVYRNGQLFPFAPEASAYIRENRLICAVRLPDRSLIAGTYQGGMIMVTDSGHLIRKLSVPNGLPNRSIFSLFLDRQGNLWTTSRNDVSKIDLDASATIFDARTGLLGKTAYAMYGKASDLTICTDDGLFHIESPNSTEAHFVSDARSHEHYWAIDGIGGHTIGGRIHGIDDLAGDHAVEILHTDDDVFSFGTSFEEPNKFWAANGFNVSEIEFLAGQAHIRATTPLPDSATSLCVDSDGGVWAGTKTKGLFQLDRNSPLRPIPVPLGDSPAPDGSALSEVTVARVGLDIVSFTADGGFILHPGQSTFERIRNFPKIKTKAVVPLVNGKGVFVSFEGIRSDGAKFDGLGLIDGLETFLPVWREFDLPEIASIGSARSMTWNGLAASPILWIGGTEGVLRVESDKLLEIKPPPPPIIDNSGLPFSRSSASREDRTLEVSYAGSKFTVHFSAPDFRHSQRLLYQTRLVGQSDEWSVPSALPMKEVSYLWEGNYEFQVRAVGESGLTSDPVSMRFHVFPPWFRSTWAYAAYLGLMIGAVAATMSWRHRAVLAKNRELGRLVSERTLELERTSAAKDEFVASISHEIRNPLNGVIGLAAALDASELAPSQRHQLSMMRQCADHLASLIEDILDFSKIEAGHVAIESKPFDVQELMESVRSVVYDQSISTGIPIDLVVEASVPPILIGDKHRIRQILLNYVSNALKYAGRGRVTVSIHAIPAAASNYDVTFVVADEGPGIPTSEQALLFTKFKRGSAARARNLGGAGLGLAVCRTLAEKMGGTTMVHSEVGNGAFFYLRLSLASPVERIAFLANPAEIKFSLAAPALIVEDQEFNAAGMVAMLQKMGVPTEVSPSAEDALLKLAKKDYVLVFTDCDLPGISGIELTKAIRRMEKADHRTIIIATTAYATRQVAEECRSAGMDGFVGKPVTLEKLRLAISTTLDARRTAPSVRFAEADDVQAKAYSLNTLRYIANDDNAELGRRLDSYVREMDDYLDELDTASRAADFILVRRTAHKLVAHLAVLEHERLCFMAQQIEESAVNRNLTEMTAKLTELKSGVRGFRRHLQTASENARCE